MKKIALVALLAGCGLLSANDYEISGMGGYTIANDDQFFDNYGTYGVEMQYNGFESTLKPELSFFYSDANYRFDHGGTKVFRTSLNGVYAFEKGNTIIPFFKAGAGYESMSHNAFGNHDGVFVDAAMGLKFPITDAISMKLEAIKMVKFNNSNVDDNLLIMGGLSFAFGDNGPKTVSIPESQPVIVPVVPVLPVVEVEKPIETTAKEERIIEPVAVVATPIDSDNDGILDPNDQCPNTAEGLKVDEYGCPLIATINDHFVFNSDLIDSTAASEIRAFVVFMNENPSYKATITGHTDSIGTPQFNQILSEKRANKVKEALISQGIASERLSAVGKGESMPVVSNMLRAGRAENRRIEIDLHE